MPALFGYTKVKFEHKRFGKIPKFSVRTGRISLCVWSLIDAHYTLLYVSKTVVIVNDSKKQKKKNKLNIVITAQYKSFGNAMLVCCKNCCLKQKAS